MPVWHEALQRFRADDAVQLVGIAQEQHPERCRLFAAWKGLDWPILWDPFNLTGSSAVPNHIAVDEHGIVRSTRARPEELEEFLLTDYPAPAKPLPVQAGAEHLLEVSLHDALSFEGRHYAALSDLLWRVPGRMDSAVETLEEQAYLRPEDALIAFRAGVARRMRYDSLQPEVYDFQAAVQHWSHALAIDPNQYIWRRRIQQYGPRMDKPYPFYSWIEKAQAALQQRGLAPIALHATLTPAELAQRGGWTPSPRTEEPDPDGRILRDKNNWITVESAAVFDTSNKRPVASVHLAFRPVLLPSVHWNNESGPMEIWIGSGDLPEGWKLEKQLLTYADIPDSITSREVRRLSFEIELPAGIDGGILEGYALLFICEDADSRCLYMRKDFAIEVLVP